MVPDMRRLMGHSVANITSEYSMKHFSYGGVVMKRLARIAEARPGDPVRGANLINHARNLS